MDNADSLGVGFAIDPEGSFESLRQIEAAMNTTEAKIVADAAKIERATGGMINVAGATVQMTSLGNEMTKTSFRAAADAARIEKAGERMVRQLERQAETFGKSTSEIRNMRAEMRAVEADSRGLTELASRLRAASAQINQLEQGTKRLPGPSNAARAATQNLGFQVQDFAVQIIGGTDALRAFAMQAPQAAGAMTGFEGKLGSVGKFLNGPWGIAITLGITLLAGFADKPTFKDARRVAGAIAAPFIYGEVEQVLMVSWGMSAAIGALGSRDRRLALQQTQVAAQGGQRGTQFV